MREVPQIERSFPYFLHREDVITKGFATKANCVGRRFEKLDDGLIAHERKLATSAFTEQSL
jgi:hypothetical protein